jgi:hypothetical protein
MNMSPTRKVPRLFVTKHYAFHSKICNLQSSYDRNVSTGVLGTGGGFPGIRQATFRNRYLKLLVADMSSRRTGFDLRLVCMGFVVDKVALTWGLLLVLPFLSCRYHPMIFPYSYWIYTSLTLCNVRNWWRRLNNTRLFFFTFTWPCMVINPYNKTN